MNDDESARLLEASLDRLPSLRGLLGRIRAALDIVEQRASSLLWADEHPWTSKERARIEGGRVTVDLHHLSQELARDAIYSVLGVIPQGYQLRLVHGRGRHSNGVCPLRTLVRELIAQYTPAYMNLDKASAGHVDITMTRSFA